MSGTHELPRRKQRGIELPILFDHTNAPRGGECTRDWIQKIPHLVKSFGWQRNRWEQ